MMVIEMVMSDDCDADDDEDNDDGSDGRLYKVP